jgi:hypothetical protein
MPRWFLNNYEDFYIACLKFNKANMEGGASFSSFLSCILVPTTMANNLKRKRIYQQLATTAGYSERQPLPDYILQAVRAVFPDPNGRCMGFKRQ